MRYIFSNETSLLTSFRVSICISHASYAYGTYSLKGSNIVPNTQSANMYHVCKYTVNPKSIRTTCKIRKNCTSGFITFHALKRALILTHESSSPQQRLQDWHHRSILCVNIYTRTGPNFLLLSANITAIEFLEPKQKIESNNGAAVTFRSTPADHWSDPKGVKLTRERLQEGERRGWGIWEGRYTWTLEKWKEPLQWSLTPSFSSMNDKSSIRRLDVLHSPALPEESFLGQKPKRRDPSVQLLRGEMSTNFFFVEADEDDTDVDITLSSEPPSADEREGLRQDRLTKYRFFFQILIKNSSSSGGASRSSWWTAAAAATWTGENF